MKYIFFIIIYILLVPVYPKAQSFINPYKNYYNTFPFAVPRIIDNSANPNGMMYTLDEQVTINPGYTGEYMISLVDHFWDIDYLLSLKAKSYKVEIVSFPFTINCFDDNGCATPATSPIERNLYMPDVSFVGSNKKWGDLISINEMGKFTTLSGSPIGGVNSATTKPEALVSTFFHLTGPFVNDRNTLPHTITKHTIFLHDGATDDTPIIDEFSFYYDNTRGRMRFYPFLKNNDPVGTGAMRWDVVFRPELIFDPVDDTGILYYYNYCNLSNELWVNGGTINYFPLSENIISAGYCSAVDPASCDDNFAQRKPNTPYTGLASDFDYSSKCIPPFALYDVFLRDVQSNILAGYSLDNNSKLEYLDNSSPSSQNGIYEGIKHEYFIDRDFDEVNDGIIHLDIINPSEKIIYNPSEVTIDPNPNNTPGTFPPITVIFPEGYTFKTILGRYPSLQQVIDANDDPQNGGPYSDLRQVPVPVNAASLPQSANTTSSDYPEIMWDDPASPLINGFYDDERFGYYYINIKATVVVDKCVNIFDARFSVYEGGTLKFTDRSTNLGYEDTDSNFGRYKIRGEGGAILRNYDATQYVQNGTIIQPDILNYIAWNSIIAGTNVDPDSDQPPGEYKIMSGSNVTFQSGDYIHLTDGFSVQGGDFHALVSTNIPIIPFCNNSLQGGGQNRVRNNAIPNKPSAINYKATCNPNPNNGTWILQADHMQSYSISNVMGQELMFKNAINSSNEQITLIEGSKGLHFVKVTSETGKIAVVKVVVE